MSDTGPHNRRPTLADVSGLAKVSTSAVSRTFTEGASVSPKTWEKVLKAAAALGFQPNVLARSLMTGRSALIGLVSNTFSNPYVMSIIDVFTLELQRRNLRPLVFNMTGQDEVGNTVQLMQQYQLDGIVIASSTLPQDIIRHIALSRIPTVMTFGRPPADTALDAVLADNVEGGRIAAQSLMDLDYDAFGFVGAPRFVTTSEDRYSGFRDQLQLAGKSCNVIHTESYSHGSGFAAARALLETYPRTDAVFCADDLLAVGVMDGLRALGAEVPEIGVMGFNDIPMASWPCYDPTTIRTGTDQIVASAIDLLENRIENAARPQEKRLIGCTLLPRGSTSSQVGTIS